MRKKIWREVLERGTLTTKRYLYTCDKCATVTLISRLPLEKKDVDDWYLYWEPVKIVKNKKGE